MKYFIYSLIILLSLCSCNGKPNQERVNQHNSMIDRIKSGELGEDIAKRAKKVDKVEIKNVDDSQLPFDVFYVEDYAGVYTFLEDNSRLVLLCQSFGGYAHSFTLIQENNEKKLNFKFDVKSGRTKTYEGSYIFGSYESKTNKNP